MNIAVSDLIAAAAVIAGFGVTVVMFRVQRELWVQDNHPDWPNWIAWADWLILTSVALAISACFVPILAFPTSPTARAIGAASCVAASILQVGYVPAILAHYRIAIGANRVVDRKKGEPAERVIVC